MEKLPDQTKLHIPLFIDHARQGSYFTLPFSMPEGIESLTLSYAYPRHRESEIPMAQGTFISRQEINIIDLGLISPDGKQVGASGSDKLSISVSETYATPGYRPCKLSAGEWQIIVGAYKVADEGVSVVYEIEFMPKHLRLYKGDLHTHTFASDGVLSIEELASHAARNGLDFLAITEHNQLVSTDTLQEHAHLTLIPGVEWTHYKGHANFLGVDVPYDEPFIANTPEEVRARFESAHARGAFISINHPYDPVVPFQFDLSSLSYDCLEIWNGPMRGSNLQSIGLWQSMLMQGQKVPICGGSDYHRDSLLLFPGGPATCVYALSASVTDLLKAIKQGHAFITFSASGPTLEMTAGNAMMGDSVRFSEVQQLEYTARGLFPTDVVQVVTNQGSNALVKAETNGSMRGVYTMPAPGFARIEILRSFLPGLPLLLALISNPIYFDG
jgi:hypothetical protein